MKDKRILYLTRTMGLGGTEKVILQLCRSFNQKFDRIVVCSNGGIHESELERLGINHYTIDDIENKSIHIIIKNIIKLIKIVKTEKIEIIHTHHRMAAFYTRILRGIFKFKFIHTAHNIFNDKRKMTQISLDHANIISVGNCVKNNLLNVYNINSKNVTTIYNAVELDSTQKNVVKEIEEYKNKGYFIVGNIGRLSKQKGMEYYIEAANIIKNKNVKIKFFIIGDGEDKDKLEKLAKSLGVNEQVIFLGYRSDIQNIMSQLDVIVLSSLWEGLPLTPIESFSVGKTIIATNIDGTNEIVKDNYNGILIEPQNSNEIALAILDLYNNADKLHRLNSNAYSTYKDKFSYDEFINRHLNYYQNI